MAAAIKAWCWSKNFQAKFLGLFAGFLLVIFAGFFYCKLLVGKDVYFHPNGGLPRSFNRWALGNASSSGLDCARVLANDRQYISEQAAHRITFVDPPDDDHLDMDCQRGVRWRNFFPTGADSEANDVDESYPLAQARIVYRDYVFLEMELAATYSPDNWYCYAVDLKADKLFQERMHRLAKCFKNVLILPEQWDISSSGQNMMRAHLGCLRLLTVPERRWNYVALLQNHDTAIKTGRQMRQIYKWLDGANDVEVRRLPAGRVDEEHMDWSFEAIRIFKNVSRNRLVSPNGFAPKLMFSKGYVASSLTRQMAEFMLNDLDLTTFVERLESSKRFGIDEILVPTLHAADALQAPGGFTHTCLDQNQNSLTRHITRVAIWHDKEKCGSHQMRKDVCVFGLEDLPVHLAVWPHLFANKFQPEFDFGAAVCWYETMFRRSHSPLESARSIQQLNREFYKELPHVRFQQFKAKSLAKLISNNSEKHNDYKLALQQFNCTNKFNYEV